MQLQKATRKKVKMRIGLSGVSGSGKTYSALLIAHGITDDWGKIAVIDSENGSASLYSNIGEFNTVQIYAPYTPEKYIQAIKVCEDAGMELIIIDSITHEWDGAGGCLDIVEELTKKDIKHNSYAQWRFVTPRHQAFIDAILQSKCHVITTVRRKQDYEMSKNSDGKIYVTKAGLKEITRDGFEYELTVNLELDQLHNATSSKDRTGLFSDKPSFIITEQTGKLIKDWCECGIDEINEYIHKLENCITVEELKMFKSILPVHVLRNEEFKKAAIERYNQIDEKSWLNEYDKKGNTTKEWLNVCEALETKKYTIEEVQSKFKLSKEMKAKLLNILKYENIKKEEPKIEQDIHEPEFEHKIF